MTLSWSALAMADWRQRLSLLRQDSKFCFLKSTIFPAEARRHLSAVALNLSLLFTNFAQLESPINFLTRANFLKDLAQRWISATRTTLSVQFAPQKTDMTCVCAPAKTTSVTTLKQ